MLLSKHKDLRSKLNLIYHIQRHDTVIIFLYILLMNYLWSFEGIFEVIVYRFYYNKGLKTFFGFAVVKTFLQCALQ